jgi:hypothetical protein
MTVIKRTGGIRAFLVERYLPIYPIYLTLWVSPSRASRPW